MNGGPVREEVVGTVIRIDSSGIGPNSGEITLVILPENSTKVVEVFAGIIPDPDRDPDPHHNHPYLLENGVYAAHMNVALAALTTGRKLRVGYIVADKPRFHGLTILA